MKKNIREITNYNEYIRECSDNLINILMSIYNASNSFGFNILPNGVKFKNEDKYKGYSTDEKIYELDIDHIFDKREKDENGEPKDLATSQVYVLLNRLYKILVIGIHIVDADIRSTCDENKVLGYRVISVTDMVALKCLHRIAILKDIANPTAKNGYQLEDTKFNSAYNKVLDEINIKAKNEIVDLVDSLVKYHNRVGLWKPHKGKIYTIINLYNIMKHGLESSDLFEKHDRDIMRSNLENYIKDTKDINIMNGVIHSKHYNKQLRKILEVCKGAIENNLIIRREEAKFFSINGHI